MNNEELPEDVAADEFLLFDANLHAEQAQQQRNLASECQHVAIEESSNAHEDRRFVVIFFLFPPPEYCINAYCSSFFQLLYGM